MSGIKVGDVVRVNYPEGGEGKPVMRFGTVESVANWGIRVLTQDGYRSMRWEKMASRIVWKVPVVVR